MTAEMFWTMSSAELTALYDMDFYETHIENESEDEND